MRTRVQVLLVAVSLIVCACAQNGGPSVSAEDMTLPITLTQAEQNTVKEGTRQSLKDPDSARFGRMVAGIKSNGDVVVCLMVNAKNSYGGYTGERPLMGLLFKYKNPMVFTVVPTPEHLRQYSDIATFQVCRDRGLAL